MATRVPRKPKAAARPKAPAKARASGKAKAPARPKASAKAKAPAKPKASAKPKVSAKAKAPAKLKAPAKAKAAANPKVTAKPKVTARPKAQARRKVTEQPGADPAGFFVARVLGEEAVREAPHPLQEAGGFDDAPLTLPAYDEALGELPWSYGDDALVALPRDPRTLYVYWDHAAATLAGAFEGLDHARAQLWLFARGDGDGWERVQVVDLALESRSWYLHDLEPGRAYRVELHLVDRRGRERPLPPASLPAALPPLGPSAAVEGRWVRIPWEVPLQRLPLGAEPAAPPGGGAAALPAGGGAGSPSSPSGPFGGGRR